MPVRDVLRCGVLARAVGMLRVPDFEQLAFWPPPGSHLLQQIPEAVRGYPKALLPVDGLLVFDDLRITDWSTAKYSGQRTLCAPACALWGQISRRIISEHGAMMRVPGPDLRFLAGGSLRSGFLLGEGSPCEQAD